MNKYAIVIIICLSFLAGCANFEKTIEKIATSPHSSESNQPRDKDQIKKSVVKITSQGRQGTGFIVGLVSNTTYILTISHVVGSNREPNIEFFGQPGEFKAKVLEIEWQQKMDPRGENGFALLVVTGSIPSEAIPLYVDNKFDLKQGDSVFTFGFPISGGDWAYDDLSYSSPVAREILFSGSDMKEGNSGGPLIKGDKVVGVVTSVTNFAHANSAENIREFLRGAKGGNIVLEHMEKWRKVTMPKPETSKTADEDERKRLLAAQQRVAAEKTAKEMEDRLKQLPEGLIIAYAAVPGSIAYGNSEHGFYTKYLLEEMQKPYQNIGNIFKTTRESVKAATDGKQTPWFTPSIRGKFCFGGCSEALPNSVKQLALVIGNTLVSDNYVVSGSGTINDARSMAAVLRAKGFEVILRTDTNFSEMNEAVQDFVKRLSAENGVGLFYFAGDGGQIKGEEYLMTIGYNGDNGKGLVSVNNIIEQINVANSKLNIIILDTCFAAAKSWRKVSTPVVPYEQE
jgi:Caspase domain/Trypsin-like peptidase domain